MVIWAKEEVVVFLLQTVDLDLKPCKIRFWFFSCCHIFYSESFSAMGKNSLAPGFRFHPTDVELVRYYLKRKVLGKKFMTNAIAEVDIYKFEPPDLPGNTLQSLASFFLLLYVVWLLIQLKKDF